LKELSVLLALIIVACGKPQPGPKTSARQLSDLEIGDSLLSINPDSAYYYYNKAVESTSDSSYKAAGYLRMALVQHNEGDYFGSEETILQSLSLLDKKNKTQHPTLAADYNLLANNCLDLENYEATQGYYDLALKFTNDEKTTGVYFNNKGVAYQKQMDYDKAIGSFETAITKLKEAPIEYAQARSNLARSRWLKNPDYAAASAFHEALEIRKRENDDWGLNASYSHLADFYALSKPDSSRQYAEKMYEIARKLESPDDQVEALQKLIRVSPAIEVKTYFLRYDRLRDSLQNARNRSKNQFALIRYETEKGKVENLRLQKNNIKQRIIIYSTISISLLVIILMVAVYWYRKRRIEWKTQKTIRENQLKTSRKVHDVVANGLYRIMNDLEHREKIEKEKLLDNIEDLYEQSRDISYEQDGSAAENYSETLNTLLTSFASSTTRVVVAGNQEKIWEKTTSKAKNELKYVLQELMINMSKHSGAQNVVLRFEQAGAQIVIHYKDDGSGLPANFQQGNGRRNTGNRIKDIDGLISFESAPGKGLEIEISFPTSTST
jgi:signal transduction histidine kinase